MSRCAALILLLAACSGGSAEREGDRAWARGDWSRALTAYAEAGDTPRLLQKQADAAWHAGRLDQVVDHLVRLVERDPTLRDEVATGLARVVQRATALRDRAHLLGAVAALHRVDPQWPLVRLLRPAAEAGLLAGPAIPDGLEWAVVAVATDLTQSTAALRQLAGATGTVGCDAALPLFRSAAARLEGTARDSVLHGAARCTLALGLAALEQARDGEAERWFDRTLGWDPAGPLGRRALVGLGDARLRQGDPAAAIIAWRAVVAAGSSDSTGYLALERLQTMALTPPDSTLLVVGRL